jgi:putative transposase
MPWSTTVEQRYELILKHLEERLPIIELASEYGISPKTTYKWIKRFLEQGRPGLEDQSRAPLRCPHTIPEKVAELLLAARKKHPTWGPRKILPWLERRHSGLELPAASTVGDLYRRHGLVRHRRRGDGPRAKLRRRHRRSIPTPSGRSTTRDTSVQPTRGTATP